MNGEPDSRPRILVVGHLTEDLTPQGPRLGGAAAFAGLLAHRFGALVTILTAADAAFPYRAPFAGIPLRRLPSRERTRFQNRYLPDGSRRQTILTRAATIPEEAIRRSVQELPPGSAVFYCPVADELGGSGSLPRPRGAGVFAGAAPQGLLRHWDSAGRVSIRWSSRVPERLAGLDLVSLSEAEFPEGARLTAPCVAVTRGRRGATLHRPGLPPLEIPVVPGSEADPTGAGDVFAAALLVGLWREVPVERATQLAAAAAAITVESFGTDGIPTLAEASVRLSASASGSRPDSPGRR